MEERNDADERNEIDERGEMDEERSASVSPTSDLEMPSAYKDMCAGCQRSIEDRFLLKVMDMYWHEHCLQCSICFTQLSGSCYARDHKLFCKYDYEKLYKSKCSGCLGMIPTNDLIMRVLDNVFHLRCFICVVCGRQLQKGDEYVYRDEQLFCRCDYEKEFCYIPLSPKSDVDSFDESESESGKGPKRPRTILTTSQRRKFKGSFELNPKPCRKVREKLAAETGLSVRVVQVWFQNQRAKVKKIARRQNQDQGEGGKSRSGKRKVKDEDDNENDLNLSNDDSTLQGPTIQQSQQYNSVMGPYDSHDVSGDMYSTQSIADTLYSDGSIEMDDGVDGLEPMLISESLHQAQGQVAGIINPIDKLYSMQSSYFNAVE